VLDRLENDLRLDPRIKALLSLMPDNAESDVANREEMLIEASSPAGLERNAGRARLMKWGGNEKVAPSVGLRFPTQEIVSSPDGNTIPVQLIRPDGYETLACLYYIHGGGMAYLSSFYANFRPGKDDRRHWRRRSARGVSERSISLGGPRGRALSGGLK
jgi:hypothetical protein